MVPITPRATILAARVSSSATREFQAPRSTRLGLETAAVACAAVVALLLLRGTSLSDPPYWDALLGLFPQAHWQAEHGLSPFLLLREQLGYVEGGACVYPFSAVPPAVALLERAVPDVTARLAILHLASFACAGAACAAVFRLARPYGRGVAWLASAAFLAQPGAQALACQIGLEMPFVATIAWTCVALAERRFAASVAWALAALLVKPTGVVAAATGLAVIGARLLFPRVAADGGRARANETRCAIGHALVCALFVAQLVLLHAFDRAPPGASAFAGLSTLATKRLWTVPEFGLALAALAFVGAIAWVRRPQHAPIPARMLAPATFLAAYVALLAQWDNPLPRYFVAAYPAVAALLVATASRYAPRAALAPSVAAVALFGLLGSHGRFQPDRAPRPAWQRVDALATSEPAAPNDGWLLERSMRFRDGLALDVEVAKFASTRDGTAFVAPWPLQQALVEPAFGYVERAVPCASAETSVAWTDVPPPTVEALRARGGELLWILTPVDFAGAASEPRADDELVARFGIGAQRARVVRRANFP